MRCKGIYLRLSDVLSAVDRLLEDLDLERRNENMKKYLFIGFMFAGLLSVAIASIGVLPVAPTISAKESVLLERAAAAAVTNRMQAVAILRAKNISDASAALDFAVGNFLFQDGKQEEAAEAYISAIKKLPTFRDALKNLGRVYLVLERDDDAIGVYQSMVENGMADADSMLLLGHALIMRSHYVSAENAYRQALLLSPANSDAQQGLVKCLLEQERYREARGLLKTILDAKPKSTELWLLLANVNMALDDHAKAITSLETASRLDCCSGVMLGLLGDLYLDAGQAQDAVERYEAAIDAGWKESQRLLRAAEGFVMIGDAKRARVMLNMIGGDKTSKQYLLLQAQLAVLEEKPKEAIKLYRTLIAADPLNGKVMLQLGDLQQNGGDLVAAELTYERAGRLEGTTRQSLVKRGQLAVQNNQFKKAVKLLEAAQAIEDKPNLERYLKQVRRLEER